MKRTLRCNVLAGQHPLAPAATETHAQYPARLPIQPDHSRLVDTKSIYLDRAIIFSPRLSMRHLLPGTTEFSSSSTHCPVCARQLRMSGARGASRFHSAETGVPCKRTLHAVVGSRATLAHRRGHAARLGSARLNQGCPPRRCNSG